MAIIGGDHEQLSVPPRRHLAVGLAAAAVFVASVVAVVVRSSSDDGEAARAASPGTTTTTATTTAPGTTTPGSPGGAPAAGGGGTSTGAGDGTPTPPAGRAGISVAGPAPAPRGSAPRLRVSGRLDFGDSLTARSLELSNDGGVPLNWSASTSSPVLSVVPNGGALAPGATLQVSVRLDRSSAPEGRLSGTVRIASDGGEGTAEVTGNVAHPPAILWVMWDKSRVAQSPCTSFPTAVAVSAAVADQSAVTVVLRWRDPSGRAGSRGLGAGPDNVHRGQLGPFTATGSVTWWVQATDALGAVSRSPDETTVVDPCP